MTSKTFYIYSFYRFFNNKNKEILKKKLDLHLSNKLVRGTILLADEGINATISGSKNDLDNIISFIRKLLKIRKLNIKINQSSFLPFNRIKVRLKREIVSLGRGSINVSKYGADQINPSDWNSIIIDKDTTVIDVRNKFEIGIGNFKNSHNPQTSSFREFPSKLEKMKLNKNKRIAIYCTGGIRCEKASAYMKMNGYKEIVQLEGGIINYLNYQNKKNFKSFWNGECFVFDDRVTVDKNLIKGKYLQCYGCRRPITEKDTLSIKYKKGVYCPFCFNERSETQKKRSLSRQQQIKYLEKNGLNNQFKKIIV